MSTEVFSVAYIHNFFGICSDESFVKLSDYNFLRKENAELKAHCKAVDEVNVKMRCCQNCKNLNRDLITEWCSKSDIDFFECDIEKDWELAE